MGPRRNRILLTSEYVGPIKSCLIGAAVGFALSIAWVAAVISLKNPENFRSLSASDLIYAGVIGAIFAVIGLMVGLAASRSRIGMGKGVVIAASLWFAFVVFYALLGLLSFLPYLIPHFLIFLPCSILVGVIVPLLIREISWRFAERLR
jgi:hypothetical protein